MKARMEGRADLSGSPGSFTQHIDACLGCMACVTACPSGVRYDRLIEYTRPEVERSAKRSIGDRLYRRLLFALFPYPARLRPLAAALRMAQRSGIQRLLRSTGLARLLTPRLAALERLAPAPSSSTDRQEIPRVVPAVGAPRLRVGVLLGCVQRVFFPAANHATARVLSREGCDVVVPPEQGCCGALMLHAGRIDDARAAARKLIDIFEHAGIGSTASVAAANGLQVDSIVINAAGCGSAMKEYGTLLADDPAYAERARAFASRCVDVSELLAELPPQAPRHPLDLRVAYHDACHLNHAQGVKEAPRAVLRSIPGLTLREVAEGDVCCGSAGVYNLLQPEAALDLRDRKVANVLRSDCDILVSSNPGCLLQISSGLEAAGQPKPTVHLVEVLDASIRNDRSMLLRAGTA
jgi:glycolate oxidase iron-sulfur subunit